MTRTKFVKNYIHSDDMYPTIIHGSMHTTNTLSLCDADACASIT